MERLRALEQEADPEQLSLLGLSLPGSSRSPKNLGD